MNKSIFFKFFILLIAVNLTFSCGTSGKKDKISHNGQQLFLSGMNLAWLNFGRDLVDFKEDLWRKALDEISKPGGNTIRWWIHVNGQESPVFDGDKVVGLPEGAIENMKYALDIAWERGMLVIPCLWSFDMLQDQPNERAERNKRFLEDPALIQTYIDNALIPMVKALSDHPALVAWEVFNEPEGMTEERGWTPTRVKMSTIQMFVNKVAGAIHKTNPKAKVSNGSTTFKVLTDVNGGTRAYSDENLIAVGGDEQGTLDFYMVHFYQQHVGDDESPFHHPASFWKLDKPLVVGEFAAAGIVDFGDGIKTSTSLTSEEAYEYLFKNGYAGGLTWTWTAHEPKFGSVADIETALMNLKMYNEKYIAVNTKGVDKMPVRIAVIPNLIVKLGLSEVKDHVDLTTIFHDPEEGTNIKFEIAKNTNPDFIKPSIDGSKLSVSFEKDKSGSGVVTVNAIDKSGNKMKAPFTVSVIDPDKGNIAIFKPVKESSNDGNADAASTANDALLTTRWSSQFADNETLDIDLQGIFLIDSAKIYWEAAFGREYEIQVSMDGTNWSTVYKKNDGKGGVDEFTFPKTKAAHVRFHGIKRGTEWGFSIWEIEVNGERMK